MPRQKYKTLILMPYLPLEGCIKFGGLLAWSYEKYRDTYVRDPALKEHLGKLVSCYKMLGGASIRNPTIISTPKKDFTNPTQVTRAKIDVFRASLLFAGVLENRDYSSVTSDNFDVYYQRFNVGENRLSTQSGAIHPVLAGGYRIDDVVFQKPDCVVLPLKFQPNQALLNAFNCCLKDSVVSPAKSQVIQAIRSFSTAYRNSDEYSWPSRILLLLMSFELLFGETERKNFRKNIQIYSVYGSNIVLPRYKYKIFNTISGALIAEEHLTLNQIWAEEFYKLRDRIIHGNAVYDDAFLFKDLLALVRRKEPHFCIAVNFFVVCVLNKLRELGFLDIRHYIINPTAPRIYLGKNISGIRNEIFKIEAVL